MGTASKSFGVSLVLILAFLSLLMIKPAFAQSNDNSAGVASIQILMSQKATVGDSFGWWAYLFDSQGNRIRNFTGIVVYSTIISADGSTKTITLKPLFNEAFGAFWGSTTVNVSGIATITTRDNYGHSNINEINVSNPPTPTPSPTLTPTPTVPELPSWIIPLLLTIMVASAGLLVYHKKHKHNLVKKV
jgi:hypothetical protein